MEKKVKLRSDPSRGKMINAFVRLFRERPGLWGSFCCFWLWPWLLSNTLRRSSGSAETTSAFSVHMWLSFFLVLAASLLIIALFCRTKGLAPSTRFTLGLGCTALPIAGATALFCTFAETDSSLVWWVASATWLIPAGVGMACLCLAWGRAFGNIGSASTLFVGVISTAIASVLIMAIVNLPLFVAANALVVIPLVCAGLLIFDFSHHPQDYEDRRLQELITPHAKFSLSKHSAFQLPWKLVVTVLLWAMSFGAVSSTYEATDFWMSYGVPTYVVAAILLLVCALHLRVDFNHLIYKIGFVTMAFGLTLMLLLPTFQLPGYIAFNMGYRFVELLVWALCAYLIHDRGISASWIVPLNVGVWTLGRWIGFSCSLALMTKCEVSAPGILTTMAFMLMVGALFLSSRGNLAEGWGIDRIPDSSLNSAILKQSAKQVSKTHGLSNRESEVLDALVQGMTRAQIAQTFFVSEETIKTHVKHIYRKLGITSREELSELIAHAMEPTVAEPGNKDSLVH